MKVSQDISDDELVRASSGGDTDAFETLYERHFQGVYDFTVRMLRNPDTAADLVQGTFIKAQENLQKRQVTGNVKAWLYTIARNMSIDELRRNKRLVAGTDIEAENSTSSPYTETDASRLNDPQAAAEDKELVELVWNSAAALSPKEYSLLDLHLRKGLTADDLAASLGRSKGNVYTMLSRLKDSLEESVTATVLIRRGRRDCPELDALLSQEHTAQVSPSVRGAIQKHLEACHRCQESKKRYVAPAEIFSGIAMVPVSLGIKGSVWQGISAVKVSSTAGSSILGEAIKLPGHWWSQATMKVKAAGLVVVGSAVGVPLAVGLALAGPASTPHRHADSGAWGGGGRRTRRIAYERRPGAEVRGFHDRRPSQRWPRRHGPGRHHIHACRPGRLFNIAR